jgi:predicted HAD superfamily phosphohydrolase YqeG
MSSALSPITPVALGIPRNRWGLRYAPDFSATNILVDFAEVRKSLGLQDDQPLHVLSDLDQTLRVTHGEAVRPDIAAHIREQLVSGAITSLTIATNTYDANFESFGPQIHDKVQTFGPRNLGIKKQNSKFFPEIANRLGITGQPTLVVGDKALRDVIGANRAGFYSLLVSPLGSKDLWFDAWGLRKIDTLALWIGSRAVRRQRRNLAS